MKRHNLGQLSDDHIVSTAHFTFHSNRWVNLHHFLYQWAQREVARAGASGPPVVDVPEMSHLDALAPPHQHTWRATLDLYQRQVILRDLIFDPVLNVLRHRLTRMDARKE